MNCENKRIKYGPDGPEGPLKYPVVDHFNYECDVCNVVLSEHETKLHTECKYKGFSYGGFSTITVYKYVKVEDILKNLRGPKTAELATKYPELATKYYTMPSEPFGPSGPKYIDIIGSLAEHGIRYSHEHMCSIFPDIFYYSLEDQAEYVDIANYIGACIKESFEDPSSLEYWHLNNELNSDDICLCVRTIGNLAYYIINGPEEYKNEFRKIRMNYIAECNNEQHLYNEKVRIQPTGTQAFTRVDPARLKIDIRSLIKN